MTIKELARIGPEFDVEFAENFPHGRSGALRLMNVGDYYYWDAGEFSRHSFHAIASKLGIRIATKKHKTISCYVVIRIK